MDFLSFLLGASAVCLLDVVAVLILWNNRRLLRALFVALQDREWELWSETNDVFD